MKKLIGIVFLIVLLQGCVTTQTVLAPLPTNQIMHFNKSKNDLYILSNSWMISEFKDAETLIQNL